MPVLQEFKDMVYQDSRLRMLVAKARRYQTDTNTLFMIRLFEEMFNQVPHSKPYLHDISGQFPTVRDFDHFILLLNHILLTAPGWTDAGTHASATARFGLTIWYRAFRWYGRRARQRTRRLAYGNSSWTCSLS